MRPFDLPFAYWAIAKTEGGYRLEFAGNPPSDGWEAWFRRNLQLADTCEFSGYIDRQAGDHRLLAFEGERLLAALFVSPEPVNVSRQWAVGQLTERHADRHARSMLVAGRPAAGRPDKGAIVCSCFSVGVNEINAAAHGGCRSVEAVGIALSAGTNCGSCRPESGGSWMRRKPLQQSDGQERIAALAKLPVFWDLSGKRVILAGGSDGAAWKAELLQACGAEVELYCEAEHLGDTMKALIERTGLTHHAHPWHVGIFSRASLALADCETDEEGQAFFCAARAAGVPVNVIDKPAFCQFQFGTIVNRSPVIVSISTDGAAPILAQAIRQRIETLLPPALKQWAGLAQSVREAVNRRLSPGPARRLFWERFVARSLSTNEPPAPETADRLLATAEQIASVPSLGSVTLVGAGPGAAELLTLKAMRALQAADVILFDDLVSPEVLELARREAKRFLVGKRGGRESCRQGDINDMMVNFAKDGKRVVRLKSGDPMIFGRAGEEIARLQSEGIAVDVVPGITAASAMAASLKVSLTNRDHAQQVRFVTGHLRNSELPQTVGWDSLANANQTSIFYMGGRMAGQIEQRLLDSGMKADTPVVVVSSISRADEQRWAGPLSSLADGMKTIGVDEPVLIGIGTVFGEVAEGHSRSHEAEAQEPRVGRA
jgi:uroporphyrin-III C-methyltransferase/precorrin-2 dehydrogenase/sirohydrochlorin ferrochelatase